MIGKPWRLTIAVFAAAVIAGCGESTAPSSSLAVDLIVTGIDGPDLNESPSGVASIECRIGLRATATGSGSARWVGATVRYFAGVSGEPPIDSVRLATVDVQSSWGSATIAPDSVRSSQWTFNAPYPFSASIEYLYEPADTKRLESVSARFDCGPVVTSDAAMPSIRTLQAVPVGGALQPGGEIDVGFEAQSPVGIWQSLITLDGACELQQLFAERLQTSVTRGARFRLPKDCELGGSVVVSAFVLDAGLRERGLTMANAIPVVDVTAPTLSPVLLSSSVPGQSTPLTGTFFPGDTLRLQFGATDNSHVSWLIWEIAAFNARDSVAVPPDGTEPLVMIPVDQAWNGPFDLRAIARDAAGLETAHQSAPGDMRILPTATVVMVADTIQWDLTDLIVDARRDRIYVLQMLPRRVAAYSMTTLALVGTAALSGSPRDMDITPGGDSLLVTVAGSGTLAVIDLLQATLSAVEVPLVLDPALSQYPDGIAALADGRALIALGSFQGLPGNHMHEIDLRTGAQRSRPDVSANGIIEGTGMARSDDGRRVVVQSGVGLRIYDLASDAFGPVQGTRGFSNVSLDVAGNRIAVGIALHDAALAFERDADALPGQELTSSRLSPLGGVLVHAWRDRGIMWSTTSDGRIQHRLTIPYSVTQMRFTPDERVLIGAGSFPGAQQSVLIRYELP